jgi:predicted transcriptional regulator
MEKVYNRWKYIPFCGIMTMENLTELDMRLYEYIKLNDFESLKWSTPDAAKSLGVEESEIYQSLANLSKHLKDKVWIYYKDGGLRVAAE